MDDKKIDSSDKIIGRTDELEILEDRCKSNRAEFIAVYGRRRVGKTYLIKNFASHAPCMFFHVTGIQNGSLEEQIDEFTKQLGNTFYNGAALIRKGKWKDVFEELTQAISKLAKNKKIILFFDEFPWMVTKRSNLLKALELYWNRYWAFDQRIKLMICGSATSWIMKNIVNNTGGLYNRVTMTIHLKPFSLRETESYLKANRIYLTRRQILDLYIVLGGVPHYWSYVKRGQSANQCINNLCFQEKGVLVQEFKKLFESLFQDAELYIHLIRIIAKYRYGISQAKLIATAKLPRGGSTIDRLQQLEEAGFITSLVPFGHKDRGVYYVIDDEYSLFYLHWIESNMKLIAKKGKKRGFWQARSKLASWKSWAGYAFESVCYKHLDQIQQALNIDPGSIAGTWRYIPTAGSEQEGAQIDLLFDRPDDTITLCEIKYSDCRFAIDKQYAQVLKKKMEIFQQRSKTKKQLFLAMVTTMGLKRTMYSEEMITGEVALDDLFKDA